MSTVTASSYPAIGMAGFCFCCVSYPAIANGRVLFLLCFFLLSFFLSSSGNPIVFVSTPTSLIGFQPNLVRMLPWSMSTQLVLFGWFPFCLRWFPVFLAHFLKKFPGPHRLSDFDQTWSECCPGNWLSSLCFLDGSRFALGGSRRRCLFWLHC